MPGTYKVGDHVYVTGPVCECVDPANRLLDVVVVCSLTVDKTKD